MSDWHVVVVEINNVVPLPNSDSLSFTEVNGSYPVIFRTGQFKEGDKAVYIPVDAVVPENDPRWDFLQGHRRIKAKKLRGTFSMGLLTEADPEWEVGSDVRDLLNITKYEPNVLCKVGGRNEWCPFDFPIYTDIEGYRKNKGILENGEMVCLTEKLHGANMRAVWKDDRLWVGSHKCVKQKDSENIWWKVTADYDLANKLWVIPDIVVFGEVYGYVQDLKYGMNKGEVKFAAFDAMNLKSRKYLDVADFLNLMDKLEIPTVPILYIGPWDDSLIEQYAEGRSTLADHVREGFICRPMVERWDHRVGRVVLKFVGEGYLLRKEG